MPTAIIYEGDVIINGNSADNHPRRCSHAGNQKAFYNGAFHHGTFIYANGGNDTILAESGFGENMDREQITSMAGREPTC